MTLSKQKTLTRHENRFQEIFLTFLSESEFFEKSTACKSKITNSYRFPNLEETKKIFYAFLKEVTEDVASEIEEIKKLCPDNDEIYLYFDIWSKLLFQFLIIANLAEKNEEIKNNQ